MLKKILLPTDGSETARRATDLAIDLAMREKAELHILTDIESVPKTANPGLMKDLIEKKRSDARELVQDIAAKAEEQGLKTQTSVPGMSTPSVAILEYCEDHDIDLIVMGTHGRSGLNRLLMGSTTERVLRSSSVPVLVVPKTENGKETAKES